MSDGRRAAIPSVARKAEIGEQMLGRLAGGGEPGIAPWIYQVREPQAVVCIHDQVATGSQHACELAECCGRRVQPWNDPECQAQLERLVLEVERVNVGRARTQAFGDAGSSRLLASTLEHGQYGVGGVNLEAALCKSD